MSDAEASEQTIDSSIPPYVPPEADGDVRSVLRTPWARRWALIVLMLMLAWTAAAWWLDTRHLHEREVRDFGRTALRHDQDGVEQILDVSIVDGFHLGKRRHRKAMCHLTATLSVQL